MILYKCRCDYRWILDFKHNQVFGPFYPDNDLFTHARAYTIEQFADLYADCFGQIMRKITP